MSGGASPRVALVSIGIGRVQRGFERYFRDLYGVLRPAAPMVLYKSAGPESDDERVPRGLWKATHAIRKAGRLAGRAEYHRDCLAYGLCLLPELRRERYDVVHCIDPPLATVLSRLRRTIGFPGRVLFTEGTQAPPRLYPRVDHIHHVGAWALDNAVALGIPRDHMTLVPCGLDFARFAPPAGREALRERYGVGASTFVVLAVTAVKRDHKRVDHLIDEVASLEGDVLLWLDGNPEDDAVLEHGKRVLGPRLRVTHVASSEVPELYGLADVLVHASLEESFGLAIVEAISSGLPVRVHDNPHFRWLTGDPDCMVAMDRPGALAASLRALRGMPRPGPARAAAIRERFDWSVVAPAYLEMYRRLA
ncbi:MAG TPA: glycosyltransferase family 4 protein [Usitatibacter sp.]|nr:glycosyltransferase family 4 protein [Usitatibacter sp.]